MYDPLTDVIQRYLQELVDSLRAARAPIHVSESSEWRKDDVGTFRRQLVRSAHAGFHLFQHKENSPLYESTVQVIAADRDFGPALDSMVGDAGHMTRFDADSVIAAAARRIADLSTGWTCQRRDVSRGLAELRRYITATMRNDKVILPLPGLKSHSWPIRLDENISIDRLSESEVAAAVTTWTLRPMHEDMPILSADECVGVRILLPTKAEIMTPTELQERQTERLQAIDAENRRPHRFGSHSRWRLNDLVDDVLFVLRLQRSEFVGTLGAVILSESPRGRSYSWMGRPTRNFMRTSYEIDPPVARKLRDTWRELKRQGATRNALPSICVRRFNAASDRVAFDDAIVDYLIAAEALFLKDAGGVEDRGELGFRLALRAAAILKQSGLTRTETYRFMKRAYDVRSGIAHGGTPPTSVRVPGRGELPVNEFVEQLGSTMRQAINVAISLYGSVSDFGTAEYWERMVIR